MRTLLAWIGLLALCALLVSGCGGGGSSNSLVGATGAITGLVSDSASAALTRAAGTATVGVDGLDATVTPGDDGAFTLGGIPAGLHTLVVRNGRHAGSLVVAVAGGKTTDIGSIVTGPAGQISGIVRSAADSLPVAGARVTATLAVLTNTADQQPVPVRIARTSGSGSYVLDGLPVGSYLVTIDKPGFESLSLSLDVSDGATTPGDASLTPAAPPADAGAVSGTAWLVDDTGAATPLAGVLIRLTQPDDSAATDPAPSSAVDANGNEISLHEGDAKPVRHGYLTYTADDGTYTLKNVPAGAYLAVAVRPGMEPDRETVIITAGATASQDFKLALRKVESGIVSGVVTDAGSGAPIEGARVCAIVVRPEEPVGVAAGAPLRAVARKQGGDGLVVTPGDYTLVAETGSDGSYQLVVPAKVTAVIAGARGYLPQTASVSVQIGGTVTADFTLASLTANYGAVTGQVTDQSTGLPIAGAEVRGLIPIAWPAVDGSSTMVFPNELPLETKTDEAGNYTLKLPAGEASLAVSKYGYARQVVSVTVTANASVTQDVALAPVSTSTVTLGGAVYQRDASGAKTPVAGATVYVDSLEIILMGAASPVAQTLTAVTGDDGTYSLALAPGKYVCYAAKDALRSRTLSVGIHGDTSLDFFFASVPILPPVEQ